MKNSNLKWPFNETFAREYMCDYINWLIVNAFRLNCDIFTFLLFWFALCVCVCVYITICATGAWRSTTQYIYITNNLDQAMPTQKPKTKNPRINNKYFKLKHTLRLWRINASKNGPAAHSLNNICIWSWCYEYGWARPHIQTYTRLEIMKLRCNRRFAFALGMRRSITLVPASHWPFSFRFYFIVCFFFHFRAILKEKYWSINACISTFCSLSPLGRGVPMEIACSLHQ